MSSVVPEGDADKSPGWRILSKSRSIDASPLQAAALGTRDNKGGEP